MLSKNIIITMHAKKITFAKHYDDQYILVRISKDYDFFTFYPTFHHLL